MKRIALLLARLYPYAWRQRYGQELEALIQDSKPSVPWLLDTLKGALTMQIKSNGLRIAYFGIAGAIIAGASSFAISDSYVGTVVLGVSDRNATIASAQRILSQRSLWQIIEKNQLYRGDRNRIPNEEMLEMMRHSIKIGGQYKLDDKPQAFTIWFQGPDRIQAKAVAEDLAQLFLKDSANGNRLIELSSPATPISPNRTTITVMGLLAGMLAAAAIPRLLRRRPSL